jgi:hypothetical protein
MSAAPTSSTSTSTSRSLPPPPASALDGAGRPRFGAYAGEVAGAADVARAAGRGALGRALRLKRWIHVWVGSERALVGLAIADVGYLGQVFGYVFDRAAHAPPVDVEWVAPLALVVRVGGGLADVSAAAASGARRMEVRAEGCGIRVAFDLGGIRGDLRVERLDVPLTVLSDMGGGLPGATIKAAGLPVSGEVSLGTRDISLEGGRAALDWTCAFFPYRTDWNWAGGAGVDRAGRPVGLNLCAGVHDGGAHTENAVWIGGRPGPLPRVRFEVGNAATKPWRIAGEDASGKVDLEFRPLGERRADVNYGALASRFRQPFGTFHGKIVDAEGRAAEVDGLGGVVEDHHARW